MTKETHQRLLAKAPRWQLKAKEQFPRNRSIFALANAVSRTVPDWRNISIQLADYCAAHPNKTDISQLVGITGEIIVNRAIALQCKNLSPSIEVNPIKDKTIIDHYIFLPDASGQITIFDRTRGRRQPTGDIDALTVVDNTPFLWEVKLTHCKTSSTSTRGFHDAIDINRLDLILQPLREYFNRPCGFVIVLYPEVITLGDRYLRNLRNNGGIVVPFFTTREKFTAQVKGLAEFLGLS